MIKRLAFIFALLLLPMTPGWAEEAAAARPTKMAVVDVQEIMKQSKAASKLRDQLEAQKNTLQKDLSKEEDGLRDQEKELADKRGVLAADAFEQKRRDFQDKVAAFQKKVQERSRDLDQKFASGSSQVRKTMLEAVADVADKNGYTMVFSRADLLIFDKTLDVTDQVLKIVDQKLPEVKPEAPAAAANGHSKK
jgi:Skp family chaperone for outer membrane proteins